MLCDYLHTNESLARERALKTKEEAMEEEKKVRKGKEAKAPKLLD